MLSLRCYLFWSQVLETMSTLETVKAFPSWSIFIPALLPLAEPLALWSEDGMFPPVEVVLPVPLAEGALLEADGLVPALPLAVVPVPGALSLMAPLPLPDVEAVVELLVLVPAGAVVVVVVVVVGAAAPLALVEPLVPVELAEPLMPELLLVLAELFDQSPCTFTE